ncbi:hypothetical protein BDK88_0591 [Natrinema hispanicum]|uniref:DUF1102 domain-containing protein n=1 Tax=Natrinema hispanicum TaxID=392421 RepID=A0A482YF98_9EURY|nr:hypothetical protein [Natrinema hispanicum]RZV11710.1 hypothetical protein BDK88_0591 [Natrinema hispanicum]
MRTNRKNVLISLGLIVAISGAALGSGAFTSVEADRGVNVQTTGDADGYLGITPGDDYAGTAYIENDSSSGDLTLNLGQNGTTQGGGTGFNQEANTTLDGLIKLTNQGENNVTVGVSEPDGSMSDSATVAIEDTEVTFQMAEGQKELAPGNTTTINVTVNTGSTSLEGSTSADVTIHAEDST